MTPGSSTLLAQTPRTSWAWARTWPVTRARQSRSCLANRVASAFVRNGCPSQVHPPSTRHTGGKPQTPVSPSRGPGTCESVAARANRRPNQRRPRCVRRDTGSHAGTAGPAHALPVELRPQPASEPATATEGTPNPWCTTKRPRRPAPEPPLRAASELTGSGAVEQVRASHPCWDWRPMAAQREQSLSEAPVVQEITGWHSRIDWTCTTASAMACSSGALSPPCC